MNSKLQKSIFGSIAWMVLSLAIVGAAMYQPAAMNDYNADSRGTLIVRVIDQQSNEPIPGATVKLDNGVYGETNSAGRIQFRDLAQGNYSILSSVNNYNSATARNVAIEPYNEQVILFTMKKGEPSRMDRQTLPSTAAVIELEELVVSVDVISL